jgi:hypothetical protein
VLTWVLVRGRLGQIPIEEAFGLLSWCLLRRLRFGGVVKIRWIELRVEGISLYHPLWLAFLSQTCRTSEKEGQS